MIIGMYLSKLQKYTIYRHLSDLNLQNNFVHKFKKHSTPLRQRAQNANSVHKIGNLPPLSLYDQK